MCVRSGDGTSDIEIERNESCVVRDGTVLRADVYRPTAAGRYPALLCRTPYDKSHPRYVAIATSLARRGYIAVVQDIRGRDASGGNWHWHMSVEGAEIETRDGYDSCEWSASLPHCDGQVGTWGNSYPSWLIWRMAAAQPPSLKAIFTSGFAPRTLDCTFGIFETGVRLRWQHHMAVSARRRVGDDRVPRTVGEADELWDRIERGKWLWKLPLAEIPDHLFGPTAVMQRRYWDEINVEFWALDRIHHLVKVPTCCLTGWWDRLLATAEHLPGMMSNGPAETRHQHRLIIGPWIHDVEGAENWIGPRDYGPHSRLSLVDLLTRWYDLHLKGIDTGVSDDRPVKAFILNANDWRFEDRWPPSHAREHSLFLRSAGHANTPAGDGWLSPRPPESEAVDRYAYDPADPVMSLIGPDGQAAACDQHLLSGRQDILVYQTAPLENDLLVLGRVACVLWASSDSPDTDFIARLIEVGTDGRAMNLCFGIVRARYREGFDHESLLEAGRPYEFRISMMAAGILFRRGSRIRLDITSSDFPAFDRNHNTGRPFHTDTTLHIARQTIFHDAARPSRLILPVIDDDGR